MIRVLRSMAVALTALSVVPAYACPVCITAPERGIAQRLIEDDLVVLARPSRSDPFQYEVIDLLRGSPEALAAAPPIPFLVPSTQRRRMANNQSLSVVLSFGPAEPQDAPARFQKPVKDLVWTQLLTHDQARAQVIRDIVGASTWGAPRPGNDSAARFDYFAALHAHPDATLRRIAWRELRIWPYERLRRISIDLDVDTLRAVLIDRNAIPDAPLAILFLANHESEAARAAVQNGARRALDGGSDLTLGAWIVALAEQNRADAVAAVAEKVLLASGTKGSRRSAAITGLTTAADAIPELRAKTAGVLAETARRHPETTPQIVAVLARWEDGQLASEVSEMLATDLPLLPSDAFVLRRYAASFATGH